METAFWTVDSMRRSHIDSFLSRSSSAGSVAYWRSLLLLARPPDSTSLADYLIPWLRSCAITYSQLCCSEIHNYLIKSQLICWTGADQAWLHGWYYLPVFIGFLLFGVVLLCEPENRRRALTSVLAQAYFLTAVVIAVMPSEIQPSKETAPAGLIAFRLSLLSGVLLLAVLSRSTYRRWYLPAGILTAAVFFGALYCDIGREARVEAKMAKLTEALPAGSRVVSFADLSDRGPQDNGSRTGGNLERLVNRVLSLTSSHLQGTHLLSRACIGHCFDFMNYEPPTGQFRIHAVPGNSVVLATYAEFEAMKSGTYMLRAGDLPLYALIRCGPEPENIFIAPLATGRSSCGQSAAPAGGTGALGLLGSCTKYVAKRGLLECIFREG